MSLERRSLGSVTFPALLGYASRLGRGVITPSAEDTLRIPDGTTVTQVTTNGARLPPPLLERIDQLAQVPQLLVASDYDGTLAPLVDDPMKAVPDRETSVAVRSLANLDHTHVGVISSRALRDLAALSRFPSEIHLVGSHGSEFDVDFALRLDPETRAARFFWALAACWPICPQSNPIRLALTSALGPWPPPYRD